MSPKSRNPGLLRDLIDVSRYDKYNGILATFAGVWGAILAGVLKIQDDPRTTVGFVLGKMTLNFVFCYIFCGAGMVWNDWVDRDIDAHVERTKNRPLASGRMTTMTSLTWIAVQYVVAYGILHYMLEGTHVWASLFPLTIGTLLYPYGKRPVNRKLGIYPQYILGLTLAFPAVPGWASIYGQEESFGAILQQCLPLLLFVFVWTVYFNTAYSYQDVLDDTKLNVNSFYNLAGKNIHALLVVLGVATLATVPWILYPLNSAWLWVSWMGLWSISYVEQFLRFDASKPESGGVLHRRNVALGLFNIFACAVELILRA